MAIQGLLQTVSQSAIESKRFSGELKRPQRHLVLSHFSADLKLKYSYDSSASDDFYKIFFHYRENYALLF